ncbi:MAG: murein hydrolase activator EnvC family protein [Peptococcaceae bacterium]
MHNWMKIKRIVAVVSIVFLTFWCTLSSVYADDTASDLEKQKNQLENEIKQTEQELKKSQQTESNLLNELATLANKVENLNADITNLDLRISQAETYITKTEAEIELKQGEVDERSDVFEQRLRDIYTQGDINPLEVLLGSQNFSDFLVRFEFLKKIAVNDISLLEELEAERNKLEEEKLALEEQKREIEELKNNKEDNKRTLQIASARQETLLSQTKEQRASLQKELDGMEKEANRIAQELLKVASKGNFTGTLQWPTPGYTRITSPFGSRIHPITRLRSFHTGIDIASPMGSKVISAAGGKIIFSGWQTAYGNMIVVDHGGLTTMYGHLSARLVEVGNVVLQGQQIGKIGTTGWSTGPHLHFEVRVNGEAISPLQYLQK